MRIVAATSKDLNSMVKDGSFRADLFYRLNSFPINLPPLRNRSEDIEALCEKFIEEIALGQHSFQKDLTVDAVNLLTRYDWPGNIRQLRNILEQAYVMSEESYLNASLIRELLPSDLAVASLPEPIENDTITVGTTLAEILRHAERQAIRSTLQATKGNKTRTARELGISRASLYEKMGRLGLQ